MTEKDNKGRFVKGNKAGTRSKRQASLATIIKRETSDGEVLIAKLLTAFNNNKTSNKDMVAIVKLLMSYGWGQPTQQIDTNIDGALSFKWEEEPSEE